MILGKIKGNHLKYNNIQLTKSNPNKYGILFDTPNKFWDFI